MSVGLSLYRSSWETFEDSEVIGPWLKKGEVRFCGGVTLCTSGAGDWRPMYCRWLGKGGGVGGTGLPQEVVDTPNVRDSHSLVTV